MMIRLKKQSNMIKIIFVFAFTILIILFFKPNKKSSYRPDTIAKFDNIKIEINDMLNKGSILSTLESGRVTKGYMASINLRKTPYKTIKHRLKAHGFTEIKSNGFCRNGEYMSVHIDSNDANYGSLYWSYPDSNCITTH